MADGKFKPGEARSPKAGRKKGTPNKRTQDLISKCEELGVDPFEILLLFAKGDWEALGYKEEMYISHQSSEGTTYKYHCDPAIRAKCAADAAQYLYPKKKAIEHSGKVGVTFSDFVAAAAGKAKKDE